jgi:hypothetical protein
MSVVGHQDFWVVGSRLYFKRDDVGATDQPWMDLGVIEAANPSLELEKLTLEDADGGLKRVVDESVAKIDETYEIVCNNISMENLSMIFLADRPESFAQTAEEKSVIHEVVAGHLEHIHDDDANSTDLFKIRNILGITDGGTLTEVVTLDSIVRSTRTFVFTGVDLTTELAVGQVFIVHEDALTDKDNAGSYTVASSAFSVDTTVVTEQTPGGAVDESGLTGTTRVSHENAGVIYDPTDDWEIVSKDRGFVRMVDGGAITTGNVTIIFHKDAITGLRAFNPQESQDEVKGECMIFWGREINAAQTVRQMRISLTPSATNFTPDEYSSVTFTVRVLNDLTTTEPAGRVVHFKGDIPATS